MAYVITFVLRFLVSSSSFGSEVGTGMSDGGVIRGLIGVDELMGRCGCGLDKDDFGSSVYAVYLAEVLVQAVALIEYVVPQSRQSITEDVATRKTMNTKKRRPTEIAEGTPHPAGLS